VKQVSKTNNFSPYYKIFQLLKLNSSLTLTQYRKIYLKNRINLNKLYNKKYKIMLYSCLSQNKKE